MATLDTVATRSANTNSIPDGKAYFETSTNQFIVWDATDGEWIQLDSDGTGAVPMSNDYSVSFDGTSYLNLGDLGTAGHSLGCMSIWLSVTSSPGLISGSGGNIGWLIGLGGGLQGLGWGYWNGNKDLLGYYAGGWQTTYDVPTSGDGLAAGYHNIVMNHNGTGYDIYIDGVIAYAATLASGNTGDISGYQTSTSGIVSGFYFNSVKLMKVDYGTGYNTTGLLDEASFWDSPLTASQISDIYNNGVPGDLGDLQPNGWWRMGESDSATDGGTVTGIQDISGNGNHATTVANSQPTFSTSVPS